MHTQAFAPRFDGLYLRHIWAAASQFPNNRDYSLWWMLLNQPGFQTTAWAYIDSAILVLPQNAKLQLEYKRVCLLTETKLLKSTRKAKSNLKTRDPDAGFRTWVRNFKPPKKNRRANSYIFQKHPLKDLPPHHLVLALFVCTMFEQQRCSARVFTDCCRH